MPPSRATCATVSARSRRASTPPSLTAFPALGTQPDLRLALERSTEANLADVLAMLGDPELPLDTGVPPDALSLAGMLVRRGVDPGDLVHAYLVAQNEFWRAWMEELAARVPAGPSLTAALERSSDRVFTRADFLVAELMRQVDRERVRWMGGALARRTQVVQELLAGDVTDPADASRALGYDLDRWVLAIVLWERGDPVCPRRARGARDGDRRGRGRRPVR